MSEAGQDSKKGDTLSPAVIAALRRGNKVDAIKIVREERNVGLKEAKDAVEACLAAQPELQAALTQAQSEGGRNFLVWLIVLLALGLLAYFQLLKP